MLMCHISLCLIILVLHPFYILPFPLLHFHSFFLTFRSAWCPTFRCPVCCRTSQHPWQPMSPPQCCHETSCVCVCVCIRTFHWAFLTCALKVKHLYRLLLNVLGKEWGEVFCSFENLFWLSCVTLHNVAVSLELSQWVWSVSCLSFIVSVTINHLEAGLLKMSASTC